MAANLTLAEAVDAALSGRKTNIRCPAHDDTAPSLSVGPGTDQPIVVHCHAGCDAHDILAAGGIDWADVCKPITDETLLPNPQWTPVGAATHVYPYRTATGAVEYEVLRVPRPDGSKTFMQRHWEGSLNDGRWVWNIESCTRILYRLAEVIAAVKEGITVYVVEGEKDVHTLAARGLIATTNPGGAGKWRPEYSDVLAGARVVICSDTNTVGRAHARAVRESLLDHNCRVTVLEPPEGRKDVTDHLMHGGSLDTMLVVAPDVTDQPSRYGVDVLTLAARPVVAVDYVIAYTLARGERLLITGLEGHGKSTLCRQIAVCVAAGIHPFSLRPMHPRKVLFIDAENHPSQVIDSWRHLLDLSRAYSEDGVQADMLTVLEEWDSEDLDLSRPEGTAWLHERVHAYLPDLVILGPLTNMVGRDLKDEEAVRRLRNTINAARSISGAAFIMEHHAPHKGPMDKERPVRPYGSSMFLKWPDFGYGLKPTDQETVYEWQRTRWPRVRSRSWPERLRTGEPDSMEWPWLEEVPL